MKLDFRHQTPFIAGTLALVLAALAPDARPQSTEPVDADALVLQLRGLRAALYTGPHSYLCSPAPAPCSPPPPPPAEITRQRVYGQLSVLGSVVLVYLICYFLVGGLQLPAAALSDVTLSISDVMGIAFAICGVRFPQALSRGSG
jgi:hypothetical protein